MRFQLLRNLRSVDNNSILIMFFAKFYWLSIEYIKLQIFIYIYTLKPALVVSVQNLVVSIQFVLKFTPWCDYLKPIVAVNSF